MIKLQKYYKKLAFLFFKYFFTMRNEKKFLKFELRIKLFSCNFLQKNNLNENAINYKFLRK